MAYIILHLKIFIDYGSANICGYNSSSAWNSKETRNLVKRDVPIKLPMSFRAVMKSILNPNMPHITSVTFKGLSTSPKTKFRVQESKQQIKSFPGISGQRRAFPYEWINKQTTPGATISCCTIYTIPYR